MIDLWNKAGNFISNAMSGDKTKDKEYQSLCKKMIIIESGIKSLKSILKGYNAHLEPFYKYLKSLNDSINKLYKNSPLRIEVNEIINNNTLILKDIDILEKKVAKLYSKTSEWDTIFIKARESMKKKDEKRKNFEHYEQKLLKIEEKKSKRVSKEVILRNREKYRTASKEYIDASEKSFEIIKNTIRLSWELTNPIFGELIIAEKDTFGIISSHLNNFSNITFVFNEIMDKEFNPEINKDNNVSYNPVKYIKSRFLNNKKEKEHIFIRKTNTFGKVPLEREEKFINIKDNLLNDNEE